MAKANKTSPRKPVASTAVRNTAIPRPAAAPAAASAARPALTHEMIAQRAYEISMSGTGGSEFDNWIRAERELRAAGGV